MKNSFKISALCALAFASVASQASVFVASSIGTYDTSSAIFYTTSETVVANVTSYTALTNLFFTATYDGPGVSPGQATYSGAGGNLVLNFTGGPFSILSGSSSISGTWNYSSGTGSYAGLVGSGTWNATYDTFGSFSATTFAGDLAPVPEPATMAVLGLGAAALLRRRRK